MRQREEVLEELRQRAARGGSLRSGANRGDWLYAAAVKRFGSWSAALAAAGFDYGTIKRRPLTAEEVLAELRRLIASSERVRADGHKSLARAAALHFGSWREALTAAGHPEAGLEWPRQRVIDAIRSRLAKGEPVNPAQVLRQDANLYAAARRRFGTWEAALASAKGGVSMADVGQPGPSASTEPGRRR